MDNQDTLLKQLKLIQLDTLVFACGHAVGLCISVNQEDNLDEIEQKLDSLRAKPCPKCVVAGQLNPN